MTSARAAIKGSIATEGMTEAFEAATNQISGRALTKYKWYCRWLMKN